MKEAMIDQDKSTQRLVERARQGDRQSFDELAARFHDRLSSTVRTWSKLRLGPPIDADQIVHETFVRAFSSLVTFEWRDEDSFFRWLCGIAKRALAQLFQDLRGTEVAVGAADDVPAAAPSRGTVQRRHERFDRLEVALERLIPEYREVLLLSRVEGLTAPQIGERMGRTPNAVRHLIVRALRDLRDKFGEETASLALPDRQFRDAGMNDE